MKLYVKRNNLKIFEKAKIENISVQELTTLTMAVEKLIETEEYGLTIFQKEQAASPNPNIWEMIKITEKNLEHYRNILNSINVKNETEWRFSFKKVSQKGE
ncbi:hypothetical protein [Solibacillus sp. FSL K6-1554]|uniref:hypothetical protein n=1 Tax=Solibacillus sp. FSL K6-1554 TaxID=2921472 RepID=UPI0030F922CA